MGGFLPLPAPQHTRVGMVRLDNRVCKRRSLSSAWLAMAVRCWSIASSISSAVAYSCVRRQAVLEWVPCKVVFAGKPDADPGWRCR